MSVTVNVTRVTTLYGKPVRESYTVAFGGGDIECRVRVLPESGSKARTVFDDVRFEDLPDEAQEMVLDQLQDVPEMLR